MQILFINTFKKDTFLTLILFPRNILKEGFMSSYTYLLNRFFFEELFLINYYLLYKKKSVFCQVFLQCLPLA